MNPLLRTAAILSGLLLSSAAAADSWTIDTSHSSVGFSVTHMLISTVEGSFSGFEGSAETDANGRLTGLQGKVSVGTVDTDSEKRDAHLAQPDFFDAAKFPEMTFQSTSVKADGRGYAVTGNLTIRDVTKPVTLSVTELKGPVADPWGNVKVGTTATARINRQDFGVSWSKSLDTGGAVVSDEVDIELRLELNKAKGE